MLFAKSLKSLAGTMKRTYVVTSRKPSMYPRTSVALAGIVILALPVRRSRSVVSAENSVLGEFDQEELFQMNWRIGESNRQSKAKPVRMNAHFQRLRVLGLIDNMLLTSTSL